MPKIIHYQCCTCGCDITDKNARHKASNCFACESEFYRKQEQLNGCHIALYACCLAFNVPLKPLLVPLDFAETEGNKWKVYIHTLNDNKMLYEKDGSPIGFEKGETDILRIFGKDMTESDFAKYCRYEHDKAGSLEQRKRWGLQWDEGKGYTTEDYIELDRLLANRKESFKGITFTPQMEETLTNVTTWQFRMDKYVRMGEIKAAKDLQSMIETALASESMRKKDEKPVEKLQIDSLILALEQQGLMKDGYLLTCDELITKLEKTFFKRKKYNYSVDVADQLLLDVMNTMRKNAGYSGLTELPIDIKTEDKLGEFEDEETEQEKINKRYAGLTKVAFTDNGE